MSQVLPESEIRRLVTLAQAGDVEARNRVVTANLRIVHRLAFQHSKRAKSLTKEDLVSEGTLGLIHAVELFNLNAGVKFLTYAVHWVRAYLGKAVMNQDELVRIPCNTRIQSRKAQEFRRKTKLRTGVDPTLEEYSAHVGVSTDRIQDVLDTTSKALVSLNQPVSESPHAPSKQDLLPSPLESADDALQRKEEYELGGQLLSELTSRERYVLRRRLCDEPDTLEQVGEQLGLTRERIRQIQIGAIAKARRNAHLRGILRREEVGNE